MIFAIKRWKIEEHHIEIESLIYVGIPSANKSVLKKCFFLSEIFNQIFLISLCIAIPTGITFSKSTMEPTG